MRRAARGLLLGDHPWTQPLALDRFDDLEVVLLTVTTDPPVPID